MNARWISNHCCCCWKTCVLKEALIIKYWSWSMKTPRNQECYQYISISISVYQYQYMSISISVSVYQYQYISISISVINLRKWGKQVKLNRNTTINEKPAEEEKGKGSTSRLLPRVLTNHSLWPDLSKYVGFRLDCDANGRSSPTFTLRLKQLYFTRQPKCLRVPTYKKMSDT